MIYVLIGAFCLLGGEEYVGGGCGVGFGDKGGVGGTR